MYFALMFQKLQHFMYFKSWSLAVPLTLRSDVSALAMGVINYRARAGFALSSLFTRRSTSKFGWRA